MDPLALLPYALAAAGGRVGPHDVSALIAAGVTMLQRSAGLVRDLAGRRAAIWLPIGPAWFVALGASDGRGAIVVDPDSSPEQVVADLRAAAVGAVFTVAALAPHLPSDLPYVLLDDAPRRALVSTATPRQEIDLGSHFGLDLTGDTSVPGSPEECVAFGTPPVHTHADVLRAARDLLMRIPYTPVDRILAVGPATTTASFGAAVVAPLLAGGTLIAPPLPSANALAPAVGELQATILVVNGPQVAALMPLLESTRGERHAFKHIVVHGALDETAFARLSASAAPRQVGVTCL